MQVAPISKSVNLCYEANGQNVTDRCSVLVKLVISAFNYCFDEATLKEDRFQYLWLESDNCTLFA